jgi:hypothetical protein
MWCHVPTVLDNDMMQCSPAIHHSCKASRYDDGMPAQQQTEASVLMLSLVLTLVLLLPALLLQQCHCQAAGCSIGGRLYRH